MEKTLDAMRKAGVPAPSSDELAQQVGAPPQAIDEMRRLGISAGKMTKVDEGLVYANETVEELKGVVRSLGPKLTVAQFRDATGSSRKYALAILEYFDTIRFTRRVGDELIVTG